MPALPSVPNVLRVQLHWTIGIDAAAITTFHWGYSGGPPSATEALTIATQVSTAAAANLTTHISPERSLTAVRVTDLASPSGADATYTHTTVGTGNGAAMVGATCVVANGHIGRRYRGGKPRVYLPMGGTSDLSNDQTWGAAFITAVNTSVAAFVTALNGYVAGSTTLTVPTNVSYYSGVNPAVTLPSGRVKQSSKLRAAAVTDVITSFSASARPGSQRRRN
jgi:hypothetical protein